MNYGLVPTEEITSKWGKKIDGGLTQACLMFKSSVNNNAFIWEAQNIFCL